MLTKKQLEEIREHLEKAQNPVFFFDNDADGLCSFLLLRRYLGRGKGVPIRSFPDLARDYFRKVRELNADYIFILDKPLVSDEFLDEVKQVNLPVVWVDHHNIQTKIPEFVDYYNPLLNKEESHEPVTEICYQVTGRKEDLWLAVVGCVSEKFVPDFYEEFKKKYPDLGINSEFDLNIYSGGAFDIYYKSQIGKIARIFDFALKDRTTNVLNMMRFLVKVKSPYEVFEENSQTYTMHKRFKELDERYKKFLEKAKREVTIDGVLFFTYGGDMSISRDLSNGLCYLFPKKIIVVGYVSGAKINISVRGKNIRKSVLGAINELEDATGGGHEDSVGVRIKFADLDKFRDKFTELVRGDREESPKIL